VGSRRAGNRPNPRGPETRGRDLARSPRKPLAPHLQGYAWGVAAPALCTLIDWPLRHTLQPASVLITYLLGVFLVATRYGRGPSIAASLLSAPAFAFFFAPPIFSLAITDLENSIGLGVMLVVAHVTSGLLERLRVQADITAQRERRATALYRLSQALAEARNEPEIVRAAVRHIRSEFDAWAVLLLPDGDGRLPAAPQGVDPEAARDVFEHGRPEGRGAAAEAGNPMAYLPLTGSRGPIGILAMPPLPQRGDPEEKAFLDMFVGQITQALERIRLAEQVQAASVQAESEALRNALLSALSHDLRTPMTRIVGTASTLAEQGASLAEAERQELARAIQEEAQHMADLMSKILDMARLTAGKLILHREWNALEEIVGGTLTRLDKALRGRSVSIRLPDPLPLIWVDAVLLQQVLTNLIENAIKYTPAGSPIEIAADWRPATLSLTVADRGPGFPRGAEARLFEKFHRLETESPQSGVGLGLALCRAIVEAHGGVLGAANRSGGGALFTLTLPLREPPAAAWEESLEAEP
jgi:two-component system sensor histidine kinase KdpD